MTIYCNCEKCSHNAEGKCKFEFPLQIGDDGKCLSYFEDEKVNKGVLRYDK